MRRLPKYRRHSSNRGFVEHGGKRHYLPGAWNSPESIEAYKTFIRDVCGGMVRVDPAESMQSIAMLVDRFIEWAEVYYPGTRGTCQNLSVAMNPLVLHYGAFRPIDFGPKRLKELQQLLASQNLARSYVNDTVRRIKQMFRWATSEELIPPSIFHALQAVPGLRQGRSAAREPEPRRMVSWDDVSATIPHLSPTLQTMVRLHWLIGCRSKSLCLAKPEQFRLDALPWEWRPRHKREFAGEELVLYIGPKARALLAPLLAIPGTPPPSGYLFPPSVRKNRRYGAFYTSQSYRQAIERGIKRAKVRKWTPHAIRHSRATLVREAHGIESAQAVIGHSSLDSVQIYAERRAKDAKRIAESEG